MIAALLLSALPAFAETHATLTASPAQVEVGQPIEVELAIEHALGSVPNLPKNLLGLDASWVVLDQAGPSLEPLAGEPGRGRTTARLRIASLEPGARELPALRVDCGGETAATEPVRVEIASLLGDGEAHERPPKGFRTNIDSFARRPRWPWVAGFALALVLGAGWWIRRRRARRAPVAIPRTPLSLLEELERGDLDQPEIAREAHFALTRILRDALDRESGGRRAGLDDDEWLRQALADAGLGPKLVPAREELAGLLRACGEVKYGGAGATQWAARERLAKARELLGRLQTAEAKR